MSEYKNIHYKDIKKILYAWLKSLPTKRKINKIEACIFDGYAISFIVTPKNGHPHLVEKKSDAPLLIEKLKRIEEKRKEKPKRKRRTKAEMKENKIKELMNDTKLVGDLTLKQAEYIKNALEVTKDTISRSMVKRMCVMVKEKVPTNDDKTINELMNPTKSKTIVTEVSDVIINPDDHDGHNVAYIA